MNSTNMMDDSGLHELNDEEMENREKPKVTYICGGNLIQLPINYKELACV